MDPVEGGRAIGRYHFQASVERKYGCSRASAAVGLLVCFSETEESISDAASEDQSPTSISHTSEASLAQYEAVTIVAAASSSNRYCVGSEEGAVNLLDTRTGGTIEFPKFLNFLSISQLAWSVDATHVVAGHLGGDISVKRVVDSPAGDNGTTHLKSLATPKVNLDGRGIHQVLFNADSTLLLIVNEGRSQIWSLDEEAVIATLFDQDMNRRWLRHPTQKSIFLGFGAIGIRVFR